MYLIHLNLSLHKLIYKSVMKIKTKYISVNQVKHSQKAIFQESVREKQYSFFLIIVNFTQNFVF